MKSKYWGWEAVKRQIEAAEVLGLDYTLTRETQLRVISEEPLGKKTMVFGAKGIPETVWTLEIKRLEGR